MVDHAIIFGVGMAAGAFLGVRARRVEVRALREGIARETARVRSLELRVERIEDAGRARRTESGQAPRKARIVNLPTRALHALALVALVSTPAAAGGVKVGWIDPASVGTERYVAEIGREGRPTRAVWLEVALGHKGEPQLLEAELKVAPRSKFTLRVLAVGSDGSRRPCEIVGVSRVIAARRRAVRAACDARDLAALSRAVCR